MFRWTFSISPEAKSQANAMLTPCLVIYIKIVLVVLCSIILFNLMHFVMVIVFNLMPGYVRLY